MKTKTELLNKIRSKAQELNLLRKDLRYQKVIGRLVYEKLLFSNHVLPHRCFITVEDALWASHIEPRILELIPAILLKRPRLLWATQPLPKDLVLVIKELKKGKAKTFFRGVAPRQYEKWLDHVGRKGKRPGLLKTFRFKPEDLHMLQKLKTKLKVDEISVIRTALKQALLLNTKHKK